MRLGGRHNMPPPVRAKFEDRSFFRLRNIEVVPKFRNWVTSPGHAQFRANLWSGGKNYPRCMCMPNLKIVAFFRLRNIEGVPKFRNWVTYPRPHPFRGQFVVRGKNCPRPMCVPNLKGVALTVCEILAHFAAVH